MSDKDLQRINHSINGRPNEESLQEQDNAQLLNRQNQYSSTPYNAIQMLIPPTITTMYSQPIRNNSYYITPFNYGNTQNIGVPADTYLPQLPVTPMNTIHIPRPDTSNIALSNDGGYHTIQPLPSAIQPEMIPVDDTIPSLMMPNDLSRKRKRGQWNDTLADVDKQQQLVNSNPPLTYYSNEPLESLSNSIMIPAHLLPQQEKQLLKLFESLDKDGYKLTDQFMQDAFNRVSGTDNRNHPYKQDPPTITTIHQLLKKSNYFKNKDIYSNDPNKKIIDQDIYNRYYMSYILNGASIEDSYYASQRMMNDANEVNASMSAGTAILPSENVPSSGLDKDFDYKEKRKYTNAQMQWAMNAATKGVSVREVSRQASVPHSTLHDKIMTQRSVKPGKPTVLRNDEEAILATFVTLLDGQGIRIPREDVKKLVMGMLPEERGHPFKDDGPHRHWFRGFYKRNPQIMIYRNQSTPIPRTKLKPEQMNQFFEEIQRLRTENLISYAAQRPQYARLDRTGFHFNIPHDNIGINSMSYTPMNSNNIPIQSTINTSSILNQNSSLAINSYTSSQQNEDTLGVNVASIPNNQPLDKQGNPLHSVSSSMILPSMLSDVDVNLSRNNNTNNQNDSLTLPLNASQNQSLHTLSSHKKWSQDSLTWAIDQVSTNRLTLKEASVQSGVPMTTIRSILKNPSNGGKRGPPTVLSDVEELALERFLIKLDDWGYKANRDELAKIVMDLVNSDGREHPFKHDGPHRHWFQGFYRRHAILDARRRASGTTLSRQDAPPELMKKFYDELNDVRLQLTSEELKNKKKSVNIMLANSSSNTAGVNNSSNNQGNLSVNPLDEPNLSIQSNDNGVTNTTLSLLSDSKALLRRGGRPKMPLFSVQPCRQRYRTGQIMQYIRDFALAHEENVDDILWSLLIQRVKGSGYKDIGDLLQQLCKRWSDEIQIGRVPQQNFDDTLSSMLPATSIMDTNIINSSHDMMSSTISQTISSTLIPESSNHSSNSIKEDNPVDTNSPIVVTQTHDSPISHSTTIHTNPQETTGDTSITDVTHALHNSLFTNLPTTVNASMSSDLNPDMNQDITNSLQTSLSIPTVHNVPSVTVNSMLNNVVDSTNDNDNLLTEV